jgi:recombinase
MICAEAGPRGCFLGSKLLEGYNYRQVAKWLTRERIPAQRAGQWKAQSVKNLVVRYRRLTGRRILIPYKRFPAPAHRRERG